MSGPVRVTPVRVTEEEVEQLAAHIGLSIASADRRAVAQQLSGLLTAARLVSEFPVPDEIEPAPVFRP
jgi:Asp-tRNA(Asn)/Glu-tRNA(Gln) amidotransferase C subunit